MDVTTLLVGLMAGLLIYVIINHFLSNRQLPPFPSTPLPVIGHIHVMDPTFPREKMEQLRDQLGDIFSFRIGPSLLVVINGYENIKEAFVKRGDDFSGRPFFYADWAADLCKLGISTNDGPSWKEQRSVTLSILRNMGMGKNSLAASINEECEEFLKALGKFEGKPTDIRDTVSHSIFNLICSIVVGERFDYEDTTFRKIIDIINYNMSHLASVGMSLLTIWPVLHYIPGDIFKVRKIIENREEFGRLFVHQFRELKGRKEYDENNMDSFIANYVREEQDKKERNQPTNMDQMNLYRIIEDLIAAGTDTTANTLMWFVLYMIHYPEVQEMIFQEINETLGEKQPTVEDKKNLNYVTAAILETQRIGNVAPNGVQHSCTRETWFKGFRIPKDTILMSCLSSIMFDKKIWGEDVDVFRPERFLEDDGSLKSSEQLIPFSVGRRACPGEALAKMELFLYVTAMVQRFKFLPPTDGQPPEIKEVVNFVRQPAAFQVRIVDRRLS